MLWALSAYLTVWLNLSPFHPLHPGHISFQLLKQAGLPYASEPLHCCSLCLKYFSFRLLEG